MLKTTDQYFIATVIGIKNMLYHLEEQIILMKKDTITLEGKETYHLGKTDAFDQVLELIREKMPKI